MRYSSEEDDQTVYLARKIVNRTTHYYIRESYRVHDSFQSHDLFYLGTAPGRYIVYPGGNAFYIDEQVLEDLHSHGIEVDYYELEKLFWPFLDPEIRQALHRFYQKKQYTQIQLSKEDEEKIHTQTHLFDKRRLHYLKYCQIDQGGLERVPAKCFHVLLKKSRDEIEQFLMEMEHVLRPFEWKEYVYAIFDLQRFFTEKWARVMPQALNQDRVDEYFIQEICRLNRDHDFWAGMKSWDSLHPYLVRYAIMFFDNQYGPSSYFEDYISSFINRSRRYKPPTSKRPMDLNEVSAMFGRKIEELKKMSRRELTRFFRQRAKKFHPDKGGEHDMFVKLTEAYNELLQEKR